MKESRFIEIQIVTILKQYELGKKISELWGENNIAQQIFYNWKVKYGGIDSNQY